MKSYLSWSGGKDSTASIILCHENGIPLDGIIFCEVMFDNVRNISGENPDHIKWVYETAIPIIEKMGYNIIVLRDNRDYLYNFNTIFQKSKDPDRNGKKHGWLIGGHCWANRLKVEPIRSFLKNVGEYQQIVGIAADEQGRLKPNQKSVLIDYGVVEAGTYSICRKYNLLSPTYEYENRNGCWFCPNSSNKELARLARRYPELWAELEKLSHDPLIVSQSFKYGCSFDSINNEVKKINKRFQLRLF